MYFLIFSSSSFIYIEKKLSEDIYLIEFPTKTLS